MKNTALITWASGGIWLEFAKLHAEKTGDVILVARSADKLEVLKKQLESEFNREVVIIVKDLSEPSAAKELYSEVKTLWIDVEYLINNAWFGTHWVFHGSEWSREKDMIQLNVTTLTELTRYFVEDMVKKGSWKILNVSSTASFAPGPLQSVYFASKAFVQSFSNALSKELENTWATVTNLMPWATQTNFWAVSWMDGTSNFDKTASAYSVALDWYNWLLAWKIDVLTGASFIDKILLSVSKILPKKVVLNLVYKMSKKD